MKKTLILASGSQDRKTLLENIGIPFEIIVSDYDEDDNRTDLSHQDLVIYLAKGKLQAVRDKINNDNEYLRFKNLNYVIIAADTVVSFKGEVIGKPKDKKDAFRTLRLFSGKTHTLITGVAMFDSEENKLVDFYASTGVKMAKLTDIEIENYLTNCNEYKNRAGAYSLSERAGLFIESIHGSPSNVIGLPVEKVYQQLKDFKIEILKEPVCG
jgi:septum formation protein